MRMREASAVFSGFCAVIIAVLLVYLALNVEFPFFPSIYSPDMVGSTTPTVGQEMSRFLWEKRGLDLIAQAVLLFASALGCIAMLRAEEKRG